MKRSEAIALGLKSYNTGKPCKWGHYSDRSVSGVCYECQRLASAKWRDENPEKSKEASARYYTANADVLRAKGREYGKANPEAGRVRALKFKQENPDYAEKHRADNLEAYRGYVRRYQEKHREELKQKSQEYRAANLEASLQRDKNWAAANPGKVKAKAAKRRAIRAQATPAWLTEEELKAIEAFYVACPDGYHVDHIVPLRGKTASGLHILANLQYLPAAENIKKGNRMTEESYRLAA